MGQALYRKYRSKNLDQVIGQEHITKTLKNALKSGKISHAYLLTGPRGVGKTSVARILAYEVNGIPYEGEKHHLDIIEIDAASNRRIDEIRDLRDKVHIAPAVGKYKVYIIDEVHMLTKEAFNALLKTLEEPPAHVIFILATTEAHKLPETIISRTQRFSFKPIDNDKLKAHLRTIAKAEKLTVDDAALELIAEHGEGSFRDSISMLDQASSAERKITFETVQQLLGLAPKELIDKLLAATASISPKQLVEVLDELRDKGFSATGVAKQLSNVLRQELIGDNTQLGTAMTATLLKHLIQVPASPNPERLLEILLLEIVLSNNREEKPIDNPQPAVGPARPSIKDPQIKKPPPTEPKPRAKNPSKHFSLELWPEILSTIKGRHSTLYSILRMGEPAFDGKTLTLGFKFAFHQKQIADAKNHKMIVDVIKEHSTQPVSLEALVMQSKPKQTPQPANEDHIATVSNIFGGAEMLES